mgnify:CR=1 FL=1
MHVSTLMTARYYLKVVKTVILYHDFIVWLNENNLAEVTTASKQESGSQQTIEIN